MRRRATPCPPDPRPQVPRCVSSPPGRRLRGGLGALLVGALVVGGCAGSQEKYDDLRSLQSTLDRPVRGEPKDRVYRNSRFRERSFPSTAVLSPELRAPEATGEEYDAFLEGLRTALVTGTVAALQGLPRFGEVTAEGPAAVECRIQAYPYVRILGQPIRPDPVFRDIRPKVLAIFTLREAATGAVVARYTTWSASEWEYGPWAMEDLQARAYAMARELEEVLE